jgi:G:T-mismatch repair DNA endonuclease (very short patch repair protein)
MSKRFSGKNNPFYGKTHSPEMIEKMRERARQWLIDHPEQLEKMLNAAMESQKKYKKTKIEIIVDTKISDLGFNYKYSKILHRKYQYDFIIEDEILLEVNGDYWHANPTKYGNGPGLKPLNDRQKFKVERDIVKKKFAEEHGYAIFYIWEEDVENGNFQVLDQIKETLQRRRDVK